MVQTVTRRRQYQSCQRNDPLLLDQPVVLYSIILAMMMMMIMILLTTVRKFCFELPLRESNDRKTNQQNSPQHCFFLSENHFFLHYLGTLQQHSSSAN